MLKMGEVHVQKWNTWADDEDRGSVVMLKNHLLRAVQINNTTT